MSKISDYELRGLPQQAIDMLGDIQDLLNNGKIQSSVATTGIPGWAANTGEFAFYSSGSDRRLYVRATSSWQLLGGFNSTLSPTITKYNSVASTGTGNTFSLIDHDHGLANSGGTVTAATAGYDVFTTSGTWTRPAGINNVFVRCWGGGGGGGGGGDAGGNGTNGAAGGGSSFGTVVSSSGGGAGGAGGNSSGAGGAGGSAIAGSLLAGGQAGTGGVTISLGHGIGGDGGATPLHGGRGRGGDMVGRANGEAGFSFGGGGGGGKGGSLGTNSSGGGGGGGGAYTEGPVNVSGNVTVTVAALAAAGSGGVSSGTGAGGTGAQGLVTVTYWA